MSFKVTVLAAAFLLGSEAGVSQAFEFSGVKTISLETNDGQTLAVGSVAFSPRGEGATFETKIDTGRFKDFFLSMREFKCFEGREIQCYVPYPYPNPRTISAGYLAWLETSLIFMFKTSAQFGATLANGLVYELTDAGDALVGEPRLVDLNEIAAPPDDGSKPPFPPQDRLETEPGARWVTRLVIR